MGGQHPITRNTQNRDRYHNLLFSMLICHACQPHPTAYCATTTRYIIAPSLAFRYAKLLYVLFRPSFTYYMLTVAINEANAVIFFPTLAASSASIYSPRLSTGITVHGYPPDASMVFIKKRAMRPFPSI